MPKVPGSNPGAGSIYFLFFYNNFTYLCKYYIKPKQKLFMYIKTLVDNLPSMAKFSQPTERIVSKFLLTLFSTSLGYNPLVTIRMTKNGADWTDILNLTLF